MCGANLSHPVLQGKVPAKQEDAWIMNRLIKQLTDMGFPVSWRNTYLLLRSVSVAVFLTALERYREVCGKWKLFMFWLVGLRVGYEEEMYMLASVCIKNTFCIILQRDPAEEALKSNNMNLDQAMSALLEKKTELDKRGMGITGHDYNNGLINKPMSCPRPPLLSKDPSAEPRLPFMDKVN